MTLYHHTDSVRLPWILGDRILRPSSNRIAGLPQDVLWATTNAIGDRTASANRGDMWRGGSILSVRIHLDEADFEPWIDAKRSLGWPAVRIAQLEGTKGAEPNAWWCRREALPIPQDSVIEVRSYADNRWRPAEIQGPVGMDMPDALLMKIGQRYFASRQTAGVSGGHGYSVIQIG